MARLLYNDRAGLQQVLELHPDRQQFVLGRQSDCDIIVHDTSVSRRHCIIVPEDVGFAVVDLGSANGTLVNDVRVTRRRLADGDVIRCGIYAVRFSDEAGRVEQAQVTLRDRYRRRSAEASLRSSVERLQAINESQAERLVQLQDAFGRVESERTGARRQVAEMQEHLRQLAAAVQHLERENVRLRSSSAVAASAPPPIPPPVEPATLDRAGLAAENQALRATVAQLEGSLAAADTFVKAAKLVPAVDRWQLASAARAAPAHTRSRASGTPDSKPAAADARAAELLAERATLRTELAQARRRLSEAEARIESMRGLVARPVSPFALPAKGAGLGSGSSLGKGVARSGPLLSALGGLGRTAGAARPGQGNADEQGRPGAGDEQRRARRAADRLCERLDTFRGESGPAGATAEELAQIALLATAIRDALA